MKITIDAKSFVEAISWVTKNYDTKDTSAYVALKANKKGEGYLFHSNPTAYLKCNFTITDSTKLEDDDNGGSVALALEGNYLQRLASVLTGSSGVIEVSKKTSGENSPLAVKTSNGNFTVPVLDVRIAKEPTIIPLGEVDDREYFDALQRLSKLCDPSNAGFVPAIGAVDIKLDVGNDKIVLMATDRYALAEITLDYEPTDTAQEYVDSRNGMNLLLPFENATLIPPSKGLTSSTSFVHEPKGEKFGYSFDDSRIAVFSLKDAEPLAYLRLKTTASSDLVNEVIVNTQEFKGALQTVSNLSWEENEIFLDITTDGDFVVRDSHSTNKMNVAAESFTVNEDHSAKFIRNIINEAFHPISTSKVRLRWKDEGTTYVLEPIMDDGTIVDNVFVFFIMSS